MADPDKALGDHRDRAQDQRLGEAELENADQNEKKIHRQRAGDSGQIYFQPRCKDRDAKVTDEFGDVFAALMNAAVDKRCQAPMMTIELINSLAGSDSPLHERECSGRPIAMLVAPVIV